MKERYILWKQAQMQSDTGKQALAVYQTFVWSQENGKGEQVNKER